MVKKYSELDKINIMIEEQELEIKAEQALIELSKHSLNNTEYYELSERDYFNFYVDIKKREKTIKDKELVLKGLKTAKSAFNRWKF